MGKAGDDVSTPSPRTSVDFPLPGVDLSGQQLNHRFLGCVMNPPSQQAALLVQETAMTPLKGLGKRGRGVKRVAGSLAIVWQQPELEPRGVSLPF